MLSCNSTSHNIMSQDYDFSHLSVLFAECMEALSIKPDGVYVDCTAGGGGHSVGILKQLGKNGILISLDKDPTALDVCERKKKTENFVGTWQIIRSDFSEIRNVLEQLNIDKVDGVLADLGVSSHQLDTDERGFSYMTEGPLDMRMDYEQRVSAREIVNEYSADELAKIIRNYGEERYAGRIASAIIREREKEPITTTTRLAEIVSRAMPAAAKKEKQHPARRTFQAIRIEVNRELTAVEKLLEDVPEILSPGGRFVVISFHSLEDRLVKDAFKLLRQPCTCPRSFPVCICGKKPMGSIITTRPIIASQEELKMNKRSKSAKLRVFERNDEEWKPLH